MSDAENSERNQEFARPSPVAQIFARPRAYMRNRPKVKASSAAAFILLPQFRLCFQGFSHIYPIFIWMIGIILLQAQLIPDDHPALRYGQPGVPKTNFRKLMGEAWFKLKTSRTTPYQWSMFGALVMMIVTLTAAIGSFIARVFLGIGDVAQAQIFLYSTPNDPYGKGVGVTDINTAVAGIDAPPPGTLFDMRIQGGNISSDYALMVLDKILRQAAADTPNGGAMQNALAGLMQIYNTGVLVIACVLIGWLIMSVIIDTAKTGTIGGGRHNMVWTPVRVIFALGLMFPLGSAGFSGGQYMVMKLAEYGSNFGTRGWAAYVTGVIANQQLLAPFAADNASSLVTGISKIMVCQVAYNAYVQQSTGALDANYAITMHQENDAHRSDMVNRYTNSTASNLCGTIQYSNTTADDAKVALSATPGTATTPMSASTPATHTDNVYVNVPLQTAAVTFRDAMRKSLADDLKDTADGTGAGPVIQTARTFACAFVARRFSDGGTPADNPVSAIPQCNGVTAAAADPDVGPQATMLAQIMQSLQTAYEGDGRTALTNYIGTGAGGPMVTEMSKRGWAGMGMWYQDIAALNGLIHGAQNIPATYTPGSIWLGSNSAELQRCAGGARVTGETCKISGLEERVTNILGDYDRWWQTSSVPGAPGTISKTSEEADKNMNGSNNAGIVSFLSSLVGMAIGDNGLITIIGRLVFPSASNALIFKSIDLAATNTYPLAQLADVGHSILGVGVLIWVGVTVLQGISSIKGLSFSLGEGFAAAAFVNGLGTIGSSMIMAGLMISFYLPILPFLRVAFAVLTWMTSVFEAVVMVPVAALAHLTSTGSGLIGGARTAWILWLNVLLRPILVVFGFIGGMLLYNSFALFFHVTFMQAASLLISATDDEWLALLCKIAYTVIYLGTLYSAANTSFKLLDVMPNALMRWMGSGSPDKSQDSHAEGAQLYAGVSIMQSMKPKFTPKIVDPRSLDGTANSPAARAANILENPSNLTDSAAARARNDRNKAYDFLNKDGKARYEKMSDRDKNRFLAHTFMEMENKNHRRATWDRGHGFSLAKTKNYGNTGKITDRFGGRLQFEGNVYGSGKRGFANNREKFRELDDPNLAAGNLAGIAVGDKLLDNLLASSANHTHTSHLDKMTAAQREIVREKIEAAMTSADASAYMAMDDDSRARLIEDYYATDPDEFAPGVDRDTVDAVTNDLLMADARESLSRMQEFFDVEPFKAMMPMARDMGQMDTDWALMTKDQKAKVSGDVDMNKTGLERALARETTADSTYFSLSPADKKIRDDIRGLEIMFGKRELDVTRIGETDAAKFRELRQALTRLREDRYGV